MGELKPTHLTHTGSGVSRPDPGKQVPDGVDTVGSSTAAAAGNDNRNLDIPTVSRVAPPAHARRPISQIVLPEVDSAATTTTEIPSTNGVGESTGMPIEPARAAKDNRPTPAGGGAGGDVPPIEPPDAPMYAEPPPDNTPSTFGRLGVEISQRRLEPMTNVRTDVVHIQDGDSRVCMAVVHSPFAGERLMNLLATVAPDPQQLGTRQRTINTLTLPDDARTFQQNQGEIERDSENTAGLDPWEIRDRQRTYENGLLISGLHERRSQSPITGAVYNEFDEHNRLAVIAALENAPDWANEAFFTAARTRFIDTDTIGKAYVQEQLAAGIEEHAVLEERFGQTVDPIKKALLSLSGHDQDRVTYAYNVLGSDLHLIPLYRQMYNEKLPEEEIMPPDVYAQFGMERVQEFINSQDPNIVRALNQHALERLTERGITLVDLQRERIYLRDLGHPRSGWDGPRFSSGLYADLLPYGAEYTISGIATPLKIKVAPNGEVNKPDNAQIVDSTFSADHLPQGLTPVIAYRVTKVTDAHGEHEVRTFLTQPEMEALVRKAHLKLPEGIKLDVFVGRLLAAASSPHVIAKAAEDLPRQTDFNAERMTEDQLFYLYSLSRHNSPYLGDKQRVGYADMLLAPTNPLIHALENAK